MSRSPILLKRGEVFGRLTVIQRTVRCASGGGRLWICRCTCGKTKKVAATSLRDGSVKSCGCLKRDATIARNKAGAIQLQKGQRFGKLTVLGLSTKRLGGAVHWKCQCDCGTIRHITTHDLREKSRSCGCTKLIATRMANTKHGHTTDYTTTLTYNAWRGMLGRCRYNATYIENKVTVCKRWETFENFVNDMGPRPSKKHWLDRINPRGCYLKRNCRWLAGRKANMRNTTKTLWVMWKGQRVPLVVVAEQTGLSLRVLSQRLHRGETVEKAITRLPYERVFRVWMRSSYIRNLLRKELAKYTD